MPEEDTPKAKVATVTAEEEPIIDAVEQNKTQKIIESADTEQAVNEIAAKIDEVENILVALSEDPSVDEIAAALGLAIALDKMGKRATAIYSGKTPNVLEFLEPQKTLEESPDILQDLIIALNKEKADHLRYKVEGDYVKIFVTPFKTRLTEDDFSYSYGDYNVDLVISLDVKSAADLDSVLREHGRIMHDASAINITTGAPGRFADMEWSNPGMSSVSEMITTLLIGMKRPELDAEIATPLLTGIVAATERFKNEHTNSETMRVAGRLMDAGADEQLVAARVNGEEPVTDLDIEVAHDEEKEDTVEEPIVEEAEPEVVPEAAVEELPEVAPAGSVDAPLLNEELMEELRRQQEEANKEPEQPVDENAKDYGKMIDEALAELNGAAPAEPAMETETPAAGTAGVPEVAETVPEAPAVSEIPATPEAPIVAETPAAVELPTVTEENPVTDLPMPSEEGILPPPPTPEVNFATEMPEMPAVGNAAAPSDPSEFKIPGM